jgi:hypothetical protein
MALRLQQQFHGTRQFHYVRFGGQLHRWKCRRYQATQIIESVAAAETAPYTLLISASRQS